MDLTNNVNYEIWHSNEFERLLTMDYLLLKKGEIVYGEILQK
jgi:hypothetical protein